MIKANIERLETLNEKLYSYDTELKNLAKRMSDLHDDITTGFYGSGTTAQLKKKVENLHTRMSAEQTYTKNLASALESCLVFYRNAETNIVESITGKDTYAKVTKSNNSVDKKAAEASTSTKYTKSKLLTEIDIALQKALSKVGNKYVYGGTDVDNGIDCSAFAQWFCRLLGINIPRTSREQAKSSQGTVVSVKDMQPGDIIYYGTGSGIDTVNHVAIYIGDGKMVNAACAKEGICIKNYDYRTPIVIKRYT